MQLQCGEVNHKFQKWCSHLELYFSQVEIRLLSNHYARRGSGDLNAGHKLWLLVTRVAIKHAECPAHSSIPARSLVS